MVGGAGRMGQALAENLNLIDGLVVSVLVDLHEPPRLFGATYYATLADVDPTGVDVVVDFSQPDSVVASSKWCATNHVGLVIGTTGLSDAQQDQVRVAATSTGVIMASNFSLGAVLSERFAAMAAPYFERVEIIELHHDRKVDAPSGTSITTAERIREARAVAGRVTPPEPTQRHTLEGARGFTRCASLVWSRTRRYFSAAPARASPSATIHTTGRVSSKVSRSRWLTWVPRQDSRRESTPSSPEATW